MVTIGITSVVLAAVALTFALALRWRLSGSELAAVWLWTERLSWFAGAASLITAMLALRPRSSATASGTAVAESGPTVTLAPGLASVGVGQLEGPVRGRDALIAELATMIGGGAGTRVHVLHGMGGCGKTTVARAVAHRLNGDVLVWWVSAANETSLWAGMRQVAVELGGRPVDIDRAWAGSQSAPDLLWRLLNAYRDRWLLVIDNADEAAYLAASPAPVSLGTGWLRPVQSRRGAVIVTTRDGSASAWGSWAQMRLIGMLPPPDAARVLLDMAGHAGDRSAARELAEKLGGLPLALRLTGAYLADTANSPWANETSSFAGYRRALTSSPVEGDYNYPLAALDVVRRAWELSLDRLHRRGFTLARPLLHLMTCFADAPLPYQAILNSRVLAASASFAGIDGSDLWRLLQALTTFGLVDLSVADTLPVGSQAVGGSIAVLHIHPLSRYLGACESPELTSVAARLIHAATVAQRDLGAPEDPSTWPLWRLLAPHASHLLTSMRPAGMGIDAEGVAAATVAAMAAYLAARYLHAHGLYGQAEVEYRAALRVQNHVLGVNHPDSLATRHNLARALHDRGRYTEAETKYREVLCLRISVLGQQHEHTIGTRHHLARLLHSQGRHEAAETEYRTVLAVRSATLGEHHRHTLATRHQLARLLHNRGQLTAAEREGRAIHDIERRVLGADHPDTLITRHQLAIVMHSQGRFQDAEAEYRTIIAQQQRTFGPDHPDTLATRHNLGRLLMNELRLHEADVEYQSVIARRIHVLV